MYRPSGLKIKNPRKKAKTDTEKFIRKTKYLGYIRLGLRPEVAARRVGLDIPVGEFHTNADILRKIDKGLEND